MNLQDFLDQFGHSLSQGSLASFLVAFAAGVVACAICPCTLPVGLGIAGMVSTNTNERFSTGFSVALSFFAGIVICLSVLGALAGHFGGLLTLSFGKYWALAMAVISAIAAIIAFYGPYLGVSQLEALRRPGIGGSFLYGAIFTLGTSAAPLLLLLSIAAATGDIFYGFFLAVAFGLGRGLPFFSCWFVWRCDHQSRKTIMAKKGHSSGKWFSVIICFRILHQSICHFAVAF